MQLIDSRRLRGPNLQVHGPAAVAEVALEPGEDGDVAVAAWRRELERLATALDFRGAEHAVARRFPGGVCFAVPSPIDVLLAATEINEWAIASASASTMAVAADMQGTGAAVESFDDARARISAALAEESRPALIALQAAARQRGVPFLWDDELVTLGMAARGRTYPIAELPDPAAVPWDELGRIPVVLVTGTNGKTTSARLVARMAKEAGHAVGNTSTDGIAVNGTVVEAGDWTGAEAARRLLRRTDIDVAVLETARGGILRRGLAIDRADAALLLNVSADHLGEFGVHDLDTMARAKAVVGHVVEPPGRVVINADDPHLVALAKTFRAPLVLFSLNAQSPVVSAHRAAGGAACFLRDGVLWRAEGPRETRLGAVAEVPITFGGTARYNIANALAAAAVGWTLGLPDDAVERALRQFDARDNPGRGQVLKLQSGAVVVTDFAHNPAAFDAVFVLVRTLRADTAQRRQLVVATTQAGDRDAQALGAQAAAIARERPARVLIWETPHLLRGRAPGEVASELTSALQASGVPRVEVMPSEVAALDAALAEAGAGDVIVVAPCIDRTGVAARLARGHA